MVKKKSLFVNKEVSRRLDSMLDKRGLSKYELSRQSGISQQLLSKSYTGKQNWSYKTLLILSEYFKVPVDWFAYGIESDSKRDSSPGGKITHVPILGFAECGTPPVGWIESSSRSVDIADAGHLRTPFILIAKGDSMRPYINPGDKLVCADMPSLVKDKTAVVVGFKSVPDTYEANAKLIRFDKKNKLITLYSINTLYPPTNHNESEIYKIYKLVRIIREVK